MIKSNYRNAVLLQQQYPCCLQMALRLAVRNQQGWDILL